MTNSQQDKAIAEMREQIATLTGAFCKLHEAMRQIQIIRIEYTEQPAPDTDDAGADNHV